MSHTALIGTGVMGETLLAGLLKAGWAAADIVGADRRLSRRQELEGRYGVRCLPEASDAVAGADTVLLLVKPQDVPDLLPELAPHLGEGTLLVSLCAGVTTAQIEQALPAGTPVVRVMPNTPAQVAEGMAAISAGAYASEVDVEKAVHIMEAVGQAVVVPERYQDAVTAISGSGPAYLFFVVEAMIDAGVMLGLPRDISTKLVNQTMFGSAKLLVESDKHPNLLREMVTSPAGTTAAALRRLEERSVKAAFMDAMEAARNRSLELGGS
ncbi:MAG: pyrroline-5-carboxylate reductase [Propionibacteriaceae bacterium]|nr:pyrroline-5-carboxylate reductase [Propionibacteriaceae bacterium]